MRVPDPRSDLSHCANEARVDAGTRLWRCYRALFAPLAFNSSGSGGGRFHFFEDSSGTLVPVLYAAESQDAAIAETIFHDIPLRGRRLVAGHKLVGRRLAEVEVSGSKPLRLVELHDPGLLRLGLRPDNLTQTSAYHYPRTRIWAQACHEQLAWAQGLIWMSARFNAARALVLFGDRVPSSQLALGASPPEELDHGAGLVRVRELGKNVGIVVATPPASP